MVGTYELRDWLRRGLMSRETGCGGFLCAERLIEEGTYELRDW